MVVVFLLTITLGGQSLLTWAGDTHTPLNLESHQTHRLLLVIPLSNQLVIVMIL